MWHICDKRQRLEQRQLYSAKKRNLFPQTALGCLNTATQHFSYSKAQNQHFHCSHCSKTALSVTILVHIHTSVCVLHCLPWLSFLLQVHMYMKNHIALQFSYFCSKKVWFTCNSCKIHVNFYIHQIFYKRKVRSLTL